MLHHLLKWEVPGMLYVLPVDTIIAYVALLLVTRCCI